MVGLAFLVLTDIPPRSPMTAPTRLLPAHIVNGLRDTLARLKAARISGDALEELCAEDGLNCLCDQLCDCFPLRQGALMLRG